MWALTTKNTNQNVEKDESTTLLTIRSRQEYYGRPMFKGARNGLLLGITLYLIFVGIVIGRAIIDRKDEKSFFSDAHWQETIDAFNIFIPLLSGWTFLSRTVLAGSTYFITDIFFCTIIGALSSLFFKEAITTVGHKKIIFPDKESQTNVVESGIRHKIDRGEMNDSDEDNETTPAGSTKMLVSGLAPPFK